MEFVADSRAKAAGGRGLPAWLTQLDRILRGDATRLSELRRGTIEVRAGGLSVVLVGLAMIYGACMGCFALLAERGPNTMQLVASTVKVPALYFLTLVVTLPSLYVFNALVGSRLTLPSVVRLLVASMGVMLAVLASLGPIVAFFSVSTTSHAFMVLLNVLVCGVSGVLGLMFLLQTLHRLSVAQDLPLEDPPVRDSGNPKEVVLTPVEPPSSLDRLDGQVLGRHVKTVFYIWVIVFGLVGAQMSWVLRPFIGDPAKPFVWFGPRESNFFQAVGQAFLNLFG
jgi:hypothetical protein